MTPSERKQGASASAGSEKRHAQRYSVELSAVCHQHDGSAIACEIKDICLTGTYLVFRQSLGPGANTAPAVGEAVELECFLPSETAPLRVRLPASVVRHYANGAGVAFQNPEPDAREALQTYIAQLARERRQPAGLADNVAAGKHPARKSPKDILNACARVFVTQTQPLIQAFLSTVDEAMLKAAEQAKNNTDQNNFFDSLGILKRRGDFLSESFHAAVMRELNTHTRRQDDDKAPDNAPPAGHAELSLMEDDSFEDWLAVKNIINQVRSTYHGQISEFELRLSTLYGKNITANNNPLDPGMYAHAFDSALHQLGFDHKINLFCLATFSNVLTEALEATYTAAIKVLEENGIEPTLPTATTPDNTEPTDNEAAPMPAPAETDTGQATAADNGPAAAAGASGAAAGGQNGTNHVTAAGNQHVAAAGAAGAAIGGQNGTNQATAVGNDPVADGASGAAAGGQSDTNQVTAAGNQHAAAAGATGATVGGQNGTNQATAVGNDPVADGASGAAAGNSTTTQPDSGGQTIYNLVRDLQQLKAQIRNQAQSGSDSPFIDPAALEQDDNKPTVAEFSTDEILNALSILQTTQTQTDGMDAGSIAKRAANILREQGDSGEAGKQIGARHGNIMDVTGNLFDILLHDVLVADSVREWINKLEIPVLKLALRDESVFTDRNHAARQVLNKIAQLEGYTSYSPNGAKNAIWEKIDALLERIVARIDSDPEIFSSSLKEVDALISIQDKAFAENIQEVINACNRTDDEDATELPETLIGRTDLEPWEKQALRLRPNDWLNFINTASGSQRLRLAWISRNHGRYVFVNLKGLKEKTLTFAQLSQRLREGTVIPLGNDNEFALDRAQQSMLDKLHKQLLFESTHDSLTGLINRREFEHRLDARLLRLSGKHNQDVLCYVDIAQFDVINSTYGYEAGDKLLTEMAGLLLRTVNGKGQLARVSDAAYAILLEEQSVTDARDIIQQQITLLKDFRFEWNDKELAIAMHTGLVPISDYEASASELLRTAEICCTTAREKGSNHIHIYQRDDEAASLHQCITQQVLQIENTIDNRNIELLRQKITPIQPHECDKPYHSEIIIRARDDQGRQLPTQDFILAAEYHDRITALDRWVVTSVLDWMRQHRDEMAAIGGFAINLSGRSLNDADFLDFIQTTVRDAGIPTDWICFEITETADINSLSDAAEFIHRIKETGCHFSLDDFGSGLSSYTYLKNLPVDYLKIDGTFVRHMHENPNDYAVVKSICDIGHFMGKKIIAEFVENDEILTLLRELGVDYAQGWGIEKPQPLV